jgi:hypothetical protein
VCDTSRSSSKITICKAVDIGTPTRYIRNYIIIEVKNLRIRAIVLDVHFDVDENKSQYVVLGYP